MFEYPDCFLVVNLISLHFVFAEREGVCPALPTGSFGICVHECGHDVECSGSKKCCGNGCGTICIDPEIGMYNSLCMYNRIHYFRI